MNVSDEIKKAIKYGIYLGSMSYEKEDKFLKDLNTFLIKKKHFCFYSEVTKTIMVSSDVEDLAEILVHRGTLKVAPMAPEGYFLIFMDVLEFISKKYKKEAGLIEDKKIPKQSRELQEDESTEDDGDMWL